MHRRTVLSVCGGGLAAGVAGCLDGGSPSGDGDEPDDATGNGNDGDSDGGDAASPDGDGEDAPGLLEPDEIDGEVLVERDLEGTTIDSLHLAEGDVLIAAFESDDGGGAFLELTAGESSLLGRDRGSTIRLEATVRSEPGVTYSVFPTSPDGFSTGTFQLLRQERADG